MTVSPVPVPTAVTRSGGRTGQARNLLGRLIRRRDAAFGLQPLDDLYHASVLLLFAALMGFLAERKMRSRLID